MSIGSNTVTYHMDYVTRWVSLIELMALSHVSQSGHRVAVLPDTPDIRSITWFKDLIFFRYCPFLFKLSWHGNDHLITRRWNSGRFSKGAYFALRIFETVKAIKKVPTPIGAIQWVCISLQVGNAVQTLFSLIMLMKWDAQDQHVCQFAQRSG